MRRLGITLFAVLGLASGGYAASIALFHHDQASILRGLGMVAVSVACLIGIILLIAFRPKPPQDPHLSPNLPPQTADDWYK